MTLQHLRCDYFVLLLRGVSQVTLYIMSVFKPKRVLYRQPDSDWLVNRDDIQPTSNQPGDEERPIGF